MNDVAIPELSLADQKQLELLTLNAQRNKVEAQRLALDASKLLGITESRLEAYKDRGFFKRCWYKFSGKLGELDRANQADLISMQKFAYAYLARLQEENLLEAKAIAVIRGNLKDLQDEIGEIHDMIGVIVQKFDKLEKDVKILKDDSALHKWKTDIEANHGRFASQFPVTCMMQIVFSCLDTIRKNNVDFASLEGSIFIKNCIKVAMGYCSLDTATPISVDNLITSLHGEVEGFGFDNFKRLVSIDVDGNPIDAGFILDNVSGAGYNALYHFVNEMDKMGNLTDNLPPEIAKNATLKTLRNTVNNPETQYEPLELSMEIIGGSLVAEEVFKEEKGIAPEPQIELSDDGGFDISSLLGDYIELADHPLLDTAPTEEDKRNYVESFSLIYATSRHFDGSHYLEAMARLFDCKACLERIGLCAVNPKRLNIPSLIKTLQVGSRKYDWCVDAVFLACEDGGNNDVSRIKAAVLSMCKALRISDDVAKRLFDASHDLATSDDSSNLVEAVVKLSGLTRNWKSILDFRRKSLAGVFDADKKRLEELLALANGINLSASNPYDSHKLLSAESQDKGDALLKKVNEAFEPLIPVLEAFNADTSRCRSIMPPEVTSFPRSFDGARKLQTTIKEALHSTLDSLALLEEGKFNDPSLSASGGLAEKFNEEGAESMDAAARQHSARKSVEFDFAELKKFPFDHSDVKYVGYFESMWYARIKEKGLWRSADGEQWEEVGIPVTDDYPYASSLKVQITDHAILVWYDHWGDTQLCARKSGQDKWFDVKLPWTDNSWDGPKIRAFYHQNGKWILHATKKTKYTYTREGFLFDSKEESSYDASQFFECDELSENPDWKLLEYLNTGDWSCRCAAEGRYVEPGGICFVEDGAVALLGIASNYAIFKQLYKDGAQFAYAFKGKPWKTANYPYDALLIPGRPNWAYNEFKASILECKGRLLCSSSIGLFKSKDGRVWELIKGIEKKEDMASLGLVSDVVVATCGGENKLHYSFDGEDFKEVQIEHKPSLIAYGSDSMLLVDTSDNTGGMYLVRVK